MKKKYEVYEGEILLGVFTAEEAAQRIGVGIDTVRQSISRERPIKKVYHLEEIESDEMSASRLAQLRSILKEKDWDGIRARINPNAFGLNLNPEDEKKRREELGGVLEAQDWDKIKGNIKPSATGS